MHTEPQPFEIDSSAPVRIQLLPPGDIVGRDGRKFRAPDAQGLLEAFSMHGMDLPVDLEHATEIKATEGEPAPAYGWIKSIVVDASGVWGNVEWNEYGRSLIETKQYRYISPVFEVDDKKRVTKLISAALTNRPNLHLKALNSQESQNQETEIIPVEIPVDTEIEEIEKPKPTEEPAEERIEMVPLIEMQQWQKRALDAEMHVHKLARKIFAIDVESTISQALRDAKIDPASEKAYREMCSDQRGLDRVKNFLATAKPLVSSNLNDALSRLNFSREPRELTNDEVAFCHANSISEKIYLQEKIENYRASRKSEEV